MVRPWESILDVFRATASVHAEAPALHTADCRVWTYTELLRVVEALAGQLQGYAKEAESLVALALPRSPDWVVGVLAAWWAGAAFVPIDPASPQYRRDFLLRDAAPAVVLTTDAHASLFAPAGLPLLGTPQPGAGPEPVEPCSLAPERLAYRIYTSGSAGRPKGVDIEHRGLVPLLRAQIDAFDLHPGDRNLWLLSPVFDASLSDIGTTLLAGATLFIEREDDLRDPSRLVCLLHQWRITHIDIPPSLLRILDPGAMPASLRTLIIGGEPCPAETVRAWARRFRLVNVYGPTEATICSSLCFCDAERWHEPLLGRPTPGVRYLLLGEDQQVLSGAAVGELAIAGAGLARGYVGLPELTRRQFIHRGGERLYRTGDRVRRREDGEYVFLARIDRQVKLHGRRIEPEEIEAILLQHPNLRTAVVLKRPLRPGEDAQAGLVAFLCPASSVPGDPELREFLADRLPPWMIPARFVRLEALPQTPTGKIDLPALAEWPLEDAPQSAAEDPVAGGELGELLRFFLGVARIDWEASFQDHGGDSLTLLRVAQAAHARGLNLSPIRLGAVPRLADLLREPDLDPGGMCADDLRRDAKSLLESLALPDSAARRSGCRPVSRILLTGATGLLGSYLLGELLRRTEARICCLVRATLPEQGRRRLLVSQPAERRPLVEGVADRLEVVCGDLRAPCLGFDVPSWRRLTDAVDLVIHNAAQVHLLHDYATLRPANVAGTGEVLRFCAEGGAGLHYVSSLAVFVGTDRLPGRFLESDDLAATDRVFGGYAQSKWAAEWLVRRSAARLGSCVVYRPGLLTGNARTGVAAGTVFLGLFVRGLARLRCLPELDAERLHFDVTPVDYAAAALAYLALHGEPGAGLQTFHLAGRRTASLAELLAAVRAAGVELEVVGWPEWRRRLAALESTAPETAAACLALARAMPEAADFARYRSLDLFPSGGVIFDQSATHAALRGADLTCPPPSPELLGRYVAFALRREPPAETAP
jgi:amino acid adenylation domain-containing protein/thioester reductase-like protein